MDNINLEDKKKIISIVNEIILSYEQGHMVTYQDINVLIELLGGVPSVDINTPAISVLCYLNTLLIRALLT